MAPRALPCFIVEPVPTAVTDVPAAPPGAREPVVVEVVPVRGDATRADRRTQVGVLLLVLFAQVYFVGPRSWNQNAHLAAVLAFVEPGTPETGSFRIDHFVEPGARGVATGDWKLVDGHYHSNKAPGLEMIGVPIYAGLYHAERVLGLQPRRRPATAANAALLSAALAALAGALAAAAIFGAARRIHGRSRQGALLAALVFGLGTLALPYGSSLWSHNLSALLLLLGWAGLLRGTRRAALAAGLALGAAVLVEYQAAAVAVALAIGVALARELRPRFAPMAAGAALPATVLALYQKAAFGDVFATATSGQNPQFLDATRVGGQFGWPSPGVIVDLVASSRLGLVPFMPVLALAALDLFGLLRGRRWDAAHGLRWGAVAGLLAMLTCFNMPHGGDATGPRYLILVLPFLCLALPDARALPRWGAVPLLALAAWSAVNMLVIDAVDVMSPLGTPNPLYGDIYPRFFAGARWRGGNLGHVLFGLGGPASTLPWLAVVAAGTVWLAVRCRRADQSLPAP